MKKPYLFLLACIPLISSCNKKGSFEDPFNGIDKYVKTGFTFSDDEKITRALTTAEIKLVNDTIQNKDENDKKIYSWSSVKEERNYLRAFSGEFKQGYNVANVMRHVESKSYKQLEDASKKQRTKTISKSNTRFNYTYGDVIENIESNEYIYYAKKKDQTYDEVDKIDDAESLNIRTKKTENEQYTTCVDSGPKVEKEGTWTADKKKACDALQFANFAQSDYISAPDTKSGADKDGNIILVKATQTKIKGEGVKEEGILELQDGRKYQAMNNTLIVTKLKKLSTWCLAYYVRQYTETVVTSDVIQPNVPVEKLKEPVPIYYVEEKASFSEEKVDISEDLPQEEK